MDDKNHFLPNEHSVILHFASGQKPEGVFNRHDSSSISSGLQLEGDPSEHLHDVFLLVN